MVSIIVPVYNVEPWLEECLDSILRQTYTDLQIILIDDGSTDGSGAICDAYAAKDARIRVFHQQNRGLSAARNRGIELASGDYLTFVDSDDYLLPDFVETMLQLAHDFNADMVSGSFVPLTDGKSLCIPSGQQASSTPEQFTGTQKMEAYLQHRKITVISWGKLYAAGLFREIRFPEGRIHEDVATSHLLVHAAKRIVHTQKSLYVYRKRPGSITTRPFSIQALDALHFCQDLISFTREHYPNLLPFAYANLVANCSAIMRRIIRDKVEFPEVERQLQSLCRKHLRTYLRYGFTRNSKFFVLLISMNTRLARFAFRLHSAISKSE